MKIFSKYQGRILLPVSIFLVCVIFVQAQTKPNPFEVKPRLTEQNSANSSTIEDVRSISPTDTLNTSADSLTRNVKTDKINVGTANPFDVDHLPVRKSSISKKTEDLKTISESTKGSSRFLFFFLLLSCAVLALVINSNRKALGLISKSLVNENMLKLFHREETIKPSSFIYLLYLIFFINISSFIYLISLRFDGPTGIITYLIILGIILFIYMMRHIGLFLIGRIFPVTKNADLFSFTIMIFNHFVGLVLLPINFFLAFGPENFKIYILWISLIFLGIILFLRTIRGFFIVSEYFGTRLFQIIIYLCAFEIAPVIILLKTVMNMVK